MATSLTSGEATQHDFDVGRVDVESRGDDQVLLAIDDAEEPVLVASGQVAGVEPTVANRLRGRFGVIQVAEHHLRAFDGQLADFSGRQRHQSGVGVDNLRLRVGQRKADGMGSRGAIERAGVRDRAGFR